MGGASGFLVDQHRVVTERRRTGILPVNLHRACQNEGVEGSLELGAPGGDLTGIGRVGR
jgi:hypothetical protein